MKDGRITEETRNNNNDKKTIDSQKLVAEEDRYA
jgi:hypothetical protein